MNAGRPFGEWWEEMTASTAGLAGELGFEPRQTESESVVLPLHHSPMNCSVFNTLRNSVRQSLAIGVLQKIPPRCSVFYSLAPGLGKRRHRPFLRNNCRQLRGAIQCSAHERLRSAKAIAIRLLTLDGRFSRASSRLPRGGRFPSREKAEEFLAYGEAE